MVEPGSTNTSNIRRLGKKRFPILSWLPAYDIETFSQDLLAGFTVGLTEIPQGIAYAVVAGLPSQYGLYAGFMGCFVYFFLGSCKDINIGPTAIMALMIQPYVSVMGPAGGILITFISGCIIFLCGLFNLGFIVEFFSYPVIAGFTTAAALNIASSQVKSLLGIPGKSDTFLSAWIAVGENIKETRLADSLLGLCTIIFLVVAKEMRRLGTLKKRSDWTRKRNIIGICIFMFSLASNAIVVILSSIIAYVFKQHGETPFKLTGDVKGGLPAFGLPPFHTTFNGTDFNFQQMLSQYGTVVIFCPLIAVLEHIAIAKAFSKGRFLDATQEMWALGLCNIMGSFVQSMPVTGSFTRTAVNNASGAKTPTCGIITGLMVLLALGFLTSTFQYIPKSTLAGVIMVAMYYLCDFDAFIVLWKTKKIDLIPLTTTLVCCLLINLEYGILIGIAINIVFVLYSSARPKIEIEEHNARIYMVKFKTGLHYTAAEYLREHILKNCIAAKSTIIVDGEYIGNIDATVAKTNLAGVEPDFPDRDPPSFPASLPYGFHQQTLPTSDLPRFPVGHPHGFHQQTLPTSDPSRFPVGLPHGFHQQTLPTGGPPGFQQTIPAGEPPIFPAGLPPGFYQQTLPASDSSRFLVGFPSGFQQTLPAGGSPSLPTSFHQQTLPASDPSRFPVDLPSGFQQTLPAGGSPRLPPGFHQQTLPAGGSPSLPPGFHQQTLPAGGSPSLPLGFRQQIIPARLPPGFHQHPRIIGGRTCNRNSTKFMIALTNTEGEHVCGGSLINSNWVLSAAHCITDDILYASNVLTRAKWVRGKGVLSVWTPVTKIDSVYVHPEFVLETVTNDIALMHLKTPMAETDDVLFVKLPPSRLDEEPPVFCPTAAIMGWGTIDRDETVIPMKLQCAELKTITHAECSSYYSILPETVMCTAVNKQVDSCFGDSGGPLMCGGVQYGIASWGVGCAEKWPGVYTRVDHYLEFIKEYKNRGITTLKIDFKKSHARLFQPKPILFVFILLNKIFS